MTNSLPSAATPPETHTAEGISRRTVLARGSALTAGIWAAPVLTTTPRAHAAGSPAPGPDRVQHRVKLFTTAQEANGSPDPLFEILLSGAWVPARSISRPGNYVPFPGTGFVDAGGPCASETVFRFRVPFTLPAAGTFDSPALDGKAQADNDVAVRVNGSAVLAAQPNNNSPVNFGGGSPAVFSTTDPTLLVPGLNYLFFDVHNVSCPMALDVLATLTYNA